MPAERTIPGEEPRPTDVETWPGMHERVTKHGPYPAWRWADNREPPDTVEGMRTVRRMP